MKYKRFQVRGQDRYMLDGKMISKLKIPPHILKNLQGKSEIDTEEAEPTVDNKCIFCGTETKMSRFINLQSIALCSEHVYAKTTGEVVQQYNKIHGVKDEVQEEKEVLIDKL